MTTRTFQPSSQERSPRRVVVIGGGILGASTAFHLSRAGCSVTVVSQGSLAGGASWRTFGWINAAQDVPAEYHRLRTLSMLRHRTLAANARFSRSISFPGALAWEKEGKTVQVVQGAEHPEEIDASYRRLRSLGHQVSLIDAGTASLLEPMIEPGALPEEGILFAEDEGWVDLPSLIAIMNSETLGLGGSIRTDPGGASIRTVGDRVVGVTLSDGSTIDADAVLVAVGADTPEVLATVGITVPTRSSKAALLITKPVEAQPRMLLRTPVGSLRAEPRGRLVIHTSTVEDETRIVDGQVTLENTDVVRDSLAEIAALFRGIETLEIDQLALGLRPIPGDGLPIMGATGLNGCYLAYAHSAATLGPILGELLAQEIVEDGYANPLLDTFRLRRFSQAG